MIPILDCFPIRLCTWRLGKRIKVTKIRSARRIQVGTMTSSQSLPPQPSSTAVDMNATLAHAALGVSCALDILLRTYPAAQRRLPSVLNERCHPLCDVFAPVSSFNWVELHNDLDIPPLSAVSPELP